MERRYDIDWLRVIAIGLLLIYHVAIGFQSWGIMIGFISNDKSWDSLWIPMTMLNVWRIPLLFFVSGMGVYFAMKRRTWGQLLMERFSRIFIPFVFGSFCIYPISDYILRNYYNWDYTYMPYPGHLWFLGNIFCYVMILSPIFFYLKKNEKSFLNVAIKRLTATPLIVLVVIGLLSIEVYLLDPNPFEMYAMTWHGFFLGLIAFFFGFCFVEGGEPFLKMMQKFRWTFLAVAVGLFVYRLNQSQMKVPVYLLVTESVTWIFSVLAFGNRYLNHSGRVLQYLSKAAYPVYILHMIFLSLASATIFKIELPVSIQFVLVLIITVAGCFVSYEVIKRVPYVRGLFGIKNLS